jgi:L-alanine-DL-glutamate epimerase-like enolase superfamily enzyme
MSGANLLFGSNPFDVKLLAGHLAAGPVGQRVAWAGVDGALWDIIGKAKACRFTGCS